MAERYGYAKGSESHTKRSPDEQRLAAPFLNGKDGHEREENIHDTHEDGEHHRIVHTHIAEDARSIIEHGIDTHSLLEHGEHDTHEDAKPTVSEKFFGLHGDGVLDVLKNLLCLRAAINLGKNAKGLLVLTYHDEIARSLRYEADKQGEETCGNSLRTKHIAPSGSDSPLCIGMDCCHSLTHFLHKRLNMVAQNEEIDEIDYQLTKDNGKLVPRYKHAADIGGSHLANVHRADGRGQTYANATDDAVDIEHHEQGERGYALLENHEFRLHAAKG